MPSYKKDSPAYPGEKGGKCDPSGTLCTRDDGKTAQAAANKIDSVAGLDRNEGPKNKNESIQLGSMRKNPEGRYAPNETKGTK